MLDGNNGGYANDWLVGDNKTGEIALFELGLKNHSVRRTKDGCFFGANFPDSPKLLREETKFDPDKKTSSPNARKARWEQLIAEHKGKIDLELGKRFETDDFDVILREARGATSGRSAAASRPRRAACPSGTGRPFYPGGTVQSKVTDAIARRADGLLGPGRSSWLRLPRRALPRRRTRSTSGCGGCSRT